MWLTRKPGIARAAVAYTRSTWIGSAFASPRYSRSKSQEEIPYRLILLYCYEGDQVLDPFAGIGTTAKVAHALGRQFIGYEIHQQYVEFALKRTSEPLHLRDQLIPKFEKWPVQDPRYQQSLRQEEENVQSPIQLIGSSGNA